MAQIGLYYREARRHENTTQAAAILAANLGQAGGKVAKDAIQRLTKE